MLRNVQGTDITSWRNVQGRTLHLRGMYREWHYIWDEFNAEECTRDGHYKLKECTGTDITSERNVQYSGQRLQVRGIRERHYKWEDSTGDRQTDITSGQNVQQQRWEESTVEVESGQMWEIEIENWIVTSKRKLQGTDARWRSLCWTLHHTVCWAAHKNLRSACCMTHIVQHFLVTLTILLWI